MRKPKKKNRVKPSRVKFVPLEGKTTPITADDLKSKINPEHLNEFRLMLTTDPVTCAIYFAMLARKKTLCKRRQDELYLQFCDWADLAKTEEDWQAIPRKIAEFK